MTTRTTKEQLLEQLRLIGEGLEPKLDKRDHKTPEEAIRWWWAYRLAEDAIECNNTKDWAHMFLDGIPAIATLEDVADGMLDGAAMEDVDELFDAELGAQLEELVCFYAE